MHRFPPRPRAVPVTCGQGGSLGSARAHGGIHCMEGLLWRDGGQWVQAASTPSTTAPRFAPGWGPPCSPGHGQLRRAQAPVLVLQPQGLGWAPSESARRRRINFHLLCSTASDCIQPPGLLTPLPLPMPDKLMNFL